MSTPSYRAPLTYSVPEPKTRFGLSGPGTSIPGFGIAGAVGGALVLLLLVAGLIWVATTGQAPRTRHPQVFAGSLVLEDYRPLTVVDLATGAVTVQLEGVDAEVGAPGYYDVQAIRVDGGTMLVNRQTGMFNMLGNDDYVLGPTTTGISLGPLPGSDAAAGFADGANAYIVRYGHNTTVSLIGPSTVEAGAQAVGQKRHRPVHALGALSLHRYAATGSRSATVARGSLWILVRGARSCSALAVAPSPKAPQGLSETTVQTWPGSCSGAALETVGRTIGLARPGSIQLWSQGRRGHWSSMSYALPKTSNATQFLPVVGADRTAWFLVRKRTGWELVGAGGDGVSGPMLLAQLGQGAHPAEPAFSSGSLYTLDQAAGGQPTIWQISTGTGRMRPVPGVPAYPAKSVTEKAVFQGVQFLVDGPRVLVNNPGSLLAVVLFTDGSHKPVVIDKSTAVVVSAAGPGDVNVEPKHKNHKQARAGHHNESHHKGQKNHEQSSTTVTTQPVPTTTPTTLPPRPVQQVVDPQVNCATTTEKPYQPEITSVTPSDEAALVTWQYRLLSEQDCLPATWAVQVTALGGAPQPAEPVQSEDGQQQLLVTGLRPGTRYEVVVTAYINRESTASEPISFATTDTGPGAPTPVVASPNGSGGWTVTWSPCRGPGCQVPADKWSVLGSACQDSVVQSPPSLTVAGSQRSVTVNAGNSAGLLGESLRFTVQGLSSDGLRGAPSAPSACTTSWQPPDAADLSLLAGAVPATQGLTAQLQVVVNGGISPLVALGGTPVTYTYSLAGQSIGPTSASQVEVPGLAAAKQYQAQVTITPTGHPGAQVTLVSATFSKTLPWPSALGMQVTGAVASDGNSGTVIATFSGLPTPPDLAAAGALQCGSEIMRVGGPLSGTQFDTPVNLDQLGGHCTLSLRLHSTDVPDPFGVPSPQLTQTFTIGTQGTDTFSAVAVPNCARCDSASIDVSYDGSSQPPGTDWTVSASAGACATSNGPSVVANFPVVLQWPETCPLPAITVTWTYLGQLQSAQAHLPGLPPAPTSLPTTSEPSSPSTVTSSTTVSSSTPTSSAPASTVPALTTTTASSRCSSFFQRCSTTTTTTLPTTTVPAATTSTTSLVTVPASTTTTTTTTTTPTTTTTTTTSTSTTTTGGSTSTTQAGNSSTASTTSTTVLVPTSTVTLPGGGSTGGLLPWGERRPPAGPAGPAPLWLLLAGTFSAVLTLDLVWARRRSARRFPHLAQPFLRHPRYPDMEATA